MRVALLGPVGDHVDALEPVAAFCIGPMAVDALYYLGDDNPFVLLPKVPDDVYSERAFWGQSERLMSATPQELESFVREWRREHACDGIERLDQTLVKRVRSPRGHNWVLCYSSRNLSPSDQSEGHVLVYGNSPEWILQRSGEQILVAPGPFESAGVMVLDDTDSLMVDVFDRRCEPVVHRRLDFAPSMLPPPMTTSP
ncbi:MAG TPA: hypothetical protein VHM70_02530 [Polyangiaceae bacterium]|nr:hypothetical protein [Polyangiaceae bacterium]